MASSDFELQTPPTDARSRELWLQHAAGFMFMEDVRRQAIAQVDAGLTEDARAAALKAVDDTMYALMMLIDGVTGALCNEKQRITLRTGVELTEGDRVVDAVDLLDGDGMCMGWHMWTSGDFGADPVARKR